MRQEKLKIKNPTGLHTRPATEFIREAKKFSSKITLIKGDLQADSKSIIKVLKLGISQNDEIQIQADGVDEDLAVNALKLYIENLKE